MNTSDAHFDASAHSVVAFEIQSNDRISLKFICVSDVSTALRATHKRIQFVYISANKFILFVIYMCRLSSLYRDTVPITPIITRARLFYWFTATRNGNSMVYVKSSKDIMIYVTLNKLSQFFRRHIRPVRLKFN